jgi:glucoamylase
MKKFILTLLVLTSTTAFALTKDLQFKRSLETVITNATMPDVYPGMVVASPSRSNPDYYFDWVRDTALTMRSLVDYYEIKKDAKVKGMIFTWIDAEARRQNLPSFTGLGEPKYTIDGKGFTGPWGRPQNDGPALRAIAMVKFARLLLAEGQQDIVLKKLYHGVLPADSVIKKDLEYTAYNWREHSFDPWEEEKGMHFYTLLAQFTALQEGAILAQELGDQGAADFYKKTSQDISAIVLSFFDDRVGIRVSNARSAQLGYKNSGLDVAPLLALLHTYPYQKIISFNHPQVVKYIETLKATFMDLYPVNKAYPNLGVAIGRYPEDRYDGYGTSGQGNPWFLSTIALGEFYCLQGNKMKQAEKQFARVLFHADSGAISEQFNLNSGFMQGARELTWSHNSYMTATMRCGLLK